MKYGYGVNYDYEKKRKIVIGIVLFIIAGVAVFFFISKMGRRRAVAGIREPIQKEATGHVDKTVSGYNVRIEFLYEYDIEALVVSTKNYKGSGVGDKLSPKDVALAWGKVAEYNKKINFHWKQSGRWVHWHVGDINDLDPVGGESGVGLQCSNNHLIPADKSAERAVKKIKKGDHIRIKGYLVNIDGTNSEGSIFFWHSSTTRSDDGDGACEVIYVKSVEWLK